MNVLIQTAHLWYSTLYRRSPGVVGQRIAREDMCGGLLALVVDACGGTRAGAMVCAKTLRVCDGDCVSACAIVLQDQNLSMTSPNDCRVACSSLECRRRRRMKRGAVQPRGPSTCPLAVLHTVQALQRHISLLLLLLSRFVL